MQKPCQTSCRYDGHTLLLAREEGRLSGSTLTCTGERRWEMRCGDKGIAADTSEWKGRATVWLQKPLSTLATHPVILQGCCFSAPPCWMEFTVHSAGSCSSDRPHCSELTVLSPGARVQGRTNAQIHHEAERGDLLWEHSGFRPSAEALPTCLSAHGPHEVFRVTRASHSFSDEEDGDSIPLLCWDSGLSGSCRHWST